MPESYSYHLIHEKRELPSEYSSTIEAPECVGYGGRRLELQRIKYPAVAFLVESLLSFKLFSHKHEIFATSLENICATFDSTNHKLIACRLGSSAKNTGRAAVQP
jgi:hypothetical protein